MGRDFRRRRFKTRDDLADAGNRLSRIRAGGHNRQLIAASNAERHQSHGAARIRTATVSTNLDLERQVPDVICDERSRTRMNAVFVLDANRLAERCGIR